MFAWRALPTRNGAATSGVAGPGAYLTVPALRSAGIRVAFTTRHGGVSEAPFSSLNLSFDSGDDAGRVRANRARALAAVGAGPETWTSARQVHGAGVTRVGRGDRGAGVEPGSSIPQVDALWTAEPGVTLVVRTADCVPILLADPSRPAIAVVHAGWRGAVAGVIGETIAAMGNAGSIIASIGPAIGPCCYEVGDEVAQAGRDAFGDAVVRTAPGGTTHLDLWRAAAIALHRAGVRDVRPALLCTRCEPHRFYSHRGGDTGRQGLLATIGWDG